MRQSPDGSVWVRTYPLTLDRDQIEPTHTHEWDQFTYAASGVIRVETAGASWMVPPHAAVGGPGGVWQAEYFFGPVPPRPLSSARGAPRARPRRCRTVNVPSLLRELVLHIARIGALDRKDARQARLIGVL